MLVFRDVIHKMLQGKPQKYFCFPLGQKKENVLFPVTLPTLIFWGLLKLFFKTFGILMSIFRLFLRIFILFQYKKVFIKKKVCLPTDPKNFGHVTGNNTYFSFGLTRPCFTGMGRLVGNSLFLTSQIGYPLNLIVYSKTCLKRPLNKKLFFQDRLSHNAGQKYCRMLPRSILQFFRPAFRAHLS